MNTRLLPEAGILVLAVAPLVKGGTPLWAWGTWSAVVFLMAGARLITANHKRPDIAVLLLLILASWMLVQLITGIAQDDNAVTEALLTTLSFAAFLWLCQSIRTPRTLTLLFWIIVGSAFCQAIYGIWSYLTDSTSILWMPREHYPGRASGTFVNPNHFAAYLNLGICLTLASMVTTQKGLVSGTPVLTRLLDFVTSPLLIVLILLISGLVMSGSIGGFSSLGASVGVMICLLALNRSQVAWLLLTGAVLSLAVIMSAISGDVVTENLGRLDQDLLRRWQLNVSAWGMLQEHWLFGVGAGAFYSVFPGYRELDLGSAFYYHAHNDYLEFAIELGLIGLVILTAFLTQVIRSNWSVLRSEAIRQGNVIALASLPAIAGVAVHSLIDFPLQIPGFAITFLALICANMGHADNGQ